MKEHRIADRILEFRDYLSLLANHIDSLSTNWKKQLDNEISQITDAHERDEYVQSFSGEYLRYDEYGTILRNSFLVSLYSYVEVELDWVTNVAKRRAKTSGSWEDDKTKSDHLTKMVAYLAGLGKLDLRKDD